MNRSLRVLALLVCGGLLFSACKKDSSAAPADSASAALPADTASAAPPATAAAAAAPADTAAAAAPADTGSAAAPPPGTGAPQTAVGVVPQRPIDDCCASLAGVAARARGRRKGERSFRAMEICPGIATLVRQGRATRSEALTQIRSALVGY